MTEYKSIEKEVIGICGEHADCWYNPAVECPYWPVCGSFRDDGYTNIAQRTEAFEAAIAARYDELKKSV